MSIFLQRIAITFLCLIVSTTLVSGAYAHGIMHDKNFVSLTKVITKTKDGLSVTKTFKFSTAPSDAC